MQNYTEYELIVSPLRTLISTAYKIGSSYTDLVSDATLESKRVFILHSD